MHVGNALQMAPDLHPPWADEVARNGAFRKILRPEVFPDAPLHFLTPFPLLPAAFLGQGLLITSSRQHQLLQQVDSCLP
jgi:hypothetical protein